MQKRFDDFIADRDKRKMQWVLMNITEMYVQNIVMRGQCKNKVTEFIFGEFSAGFLNFNLF